MRNALTLYRRLDRGPVARMMTDFDEVFARALRNQGFQDRSQTGDTAPRQRELFDPHVELEESDHAFQLNFDIPGVKKEDLKIDVHGKTLTVSGERKRETRDKEGVVTLRSGGQFERRFTLPDTVQTDKIDAKLENGVLELVLPKAELAKPRHIEIHAVAK